MPDPEKQRLQFGPFTVDLNTREVWKGGVRVRLGGQPLEILATLLEKPGQLVTREQLRKKIWMENTFVDFNHGLNAAVNKLREALCDSAEQPRYIETLPRRGYRFIAKIEEPATPPLPAVDLSAEVQPPAWKGSLESEEWQSTVPVRRQTLSWLWIFAATVLLGFLGFRILKQPPESRDWEASEREAKLLLARSNSQTPSIWNLRVAEAADSEGATRVVSGPEAVGGPQPSPDGKRLVYMAGHIDAMEIWVSNADGSSPLQLTSMGKCGTPRWSPDSHWIAFDADQRPGHTGIYVVSADGGPVRALFDDSGNDLVPSWSRDGKWVYFSSNRADGETDQVWKVSVDGTQTLQVTRHGGFSAYEAFDGRSIYYAKTRMANPEIWQAPVDGGSESRVSPLLRPSTWANWALTENGILFLNESNDRASTLEHFDFATRGVRPLGTLEKASFWLGASADGRSVWYSELTQEQARLVFRTEND